MNLAINSRTGLFALSNCITLNTTGLFALSDCITLNTTGLFALSDCNTLNTTGLFALSDCNTLNTTGLFALSNFITHSQGLQRDMLFSSRILPEEEIRQLSKRCVCVCV
jgi:hypothetical protein